MGIYYKWASLTKKEFLEPRIVKCPCELSTLDMLQRLAEGRWRGDEVSLVGDFSEEIYFQEWPSFDEEDMDEYCSGDGAMVIGRNIPVSAWNIAALTPEVVDGIRADALRLAKAGGENG